MGNYISCTLSTSTAGAGGGGIKVIFPSGEIEKLEGVKAAELMLEMPNFFVVNSRSLKIGRRFSALNADEELECGNSYVMLPMKRLNSLVTASDMGRALLRVSASAKVRDVVPEELKLDHDIEDFSSPDPEFMHRLSMSRSKKPLLETIAEEPS